MTRVLRWRHRATASPIRHKWVQLTLSLHYTTTKVRSMLGSILYLPYMLIESLIESLNMSRAQSWPRLSSDIWSLATPLKSCCCQTDAKLRTLESHCRTPEHVCVFHLKWQLDASDMWSALSVNAVLAPVRRRKVKRKTNRFKFASTIFWYHQRIKKIHSFSWRWDHEEHVFLCSCTYWTLLCKIRSRCLNGSWQLNMTKDSLNSYTENILKSAQDTQRYKLYIDVNWELWYLEATNLWVAGRVVSVLRMWRRVWWAKEHRAFVFLAVRTAWLWCWPWTLPRTCGLDYRAQGFSVWNMNEREAVLTSMQESRL